MITREQLELAALAAGHEVVCELDAFLGRNVEGVACGAVMLRGVQCPWRPHLDDGDAARLAARLNMLTEVTVLVAEAYGPERCTNRRIAHDSTEPDKLRAWREAVVLCAAAVGEQMKGGAR